MQMHTRWNHIITEYLQIKGRPTFNATKNIINLLAEKSKHMLDKLNLIHQTLLINLLFYKTLEEETICDLQHGTNENPTNEMNDERGLQGLGHQRPHTLP
jgi:hypothetical protein